MLKAKTRSPLQRLGFAVSAVFGVTLVGILYYHWRSGMGWADAVYMTVITLSTVGFEEIRPLSPEGRWFTILLITTGLGLALYTVVSAAEFLVEGRLMDVLGRRSMEKALAKMNDHVVLCGFGRLGRVVAQELQRAKTPAVVVDINPELETELIQMEMPCVMGSALETAVLERAGVSRARAIVISTPSDADSVFIALSAREMNGSITIHARAETEAGERHLRLAGADQIISPYRLGGQRIANALLRPAVMDFIEIASPGGDTDIVLEEVRLGEACALDGVTLAELPRHDVRIAVVGIQRPDAPMTLMPRAEAALHAGDRIVVVGEEVQLARLSQLAQAG